MTDAELLAFAERTPFSVPQVSFARQTLRDAELAEDCIGSVLNACGELACAFNISLQTALEVFIRGAKEDEERWLQGEGSREPKGLLGAD